MPPLPPRKGAHLGHPRVDRHRRGVTRNPRGPVCLGDTRARGDSGGDRARSRPPAETVPARRRRRPRRRAVAQADAGGVHRLLARHRHRSGDDHLGVTVGVGPYLALSAASVWDRVIASAPEVRPARVSKARTGLRRTAGAHGVHGQTRVVSDVPRPEGR